jgi:hypothetical protein
MLALGLILIVISAIALLAALAGGSNDPAQFDLGIFEVQTNTMGVFLIGAATVLLFVMGLELTRSGVRRANRRRKEQKEYQRLSEKYADRNAADSDRGSATGPSDTGSDPTDDPADDPAKESSLGADPADRATPRRASDPE